MSKLQRQELLSRRHEVRAEKLSRAVHAVGGLWTSQGDVERHLADQPSEREQRMAVETQLKYRRFVLRCPSKSGLFALSAGGKKLALEVLTGNLVQVIQEASERAASITPAEPEQVIVIEKAIFEKEKSRFRELVEKERQHVPTKRRRTSSEASPDLVPEVPNPEDLVGKRIRLLATGTSRARFGIVSEVKQSLTGKNANKHVFTVLFDQCKSLSRLPLLEHLESGNLSFPAPSGEFFVGRRVEHRFKSEEDGEDYWFTGTVLSFDKSRGLHNIQYDYEDGEEDDEEADEEADEDAENAIYEEPLTEDYLSGDVRILIS